ncbi:hypothetical protein E3N88_34291 [Mikania micrantha]|uniref:Uncharacterized protein n=1 Tax=Mikania micrantha TaxID=192012 RepID=A0A5N6LXZ6_9ASTR|nr:hypothetical protein E3N88_34291 [Mikania micrantha]
MKFQLGNMVWIVEHEVPANGSKKGCKHIKGNPSNKVITRGVQRMKALPLEVKDEIKEYFKQVETTKFNSQWNFEETIDAGAYFVSTARETGSADSCPCVKKGVQNKQQECDYQNFPLVYFSPPNLLSSTICILELHLYKDMDVKGQTIPPACDRSAGRVEATGRMATDDRLEVDGRRRWLCEWEAMDGDLGRERKHSRVK